MISVHANGDTVVDWEDWSAPLRQFAQASGLVVSAYDNHARRQTGPLHSSRTAALLASSNLWRDGGPGALLEQELAIQVLDHGAAVATTFCDALRISAMPLTRFGKTYGVIVYGWSFRDFSSPMACDRIARQVGLLGHALWGEVRLESPVSDARMAVLTSLLRTLVDSTDRHREAIAELNRVNRAREQFLATVSHEMRTPLAALSLRLELMQRTMPDLPEAAKSSIGIMRKHVAQESLMVNDLIDASRTLTGQMSIERQPVSLGQVLHDAVSTVEINAHDKQITLQVTPADYAARVLIEADPQRLQQVVWNLLLNAVKFTPEGGRIVLKVRQEARHVVIEVIDSGQGIEAHDLEHVFGAFNLQKQGNDSGLGLGLYIARHIVELHGGTITVTSAGLGHGATFSIRLPLGAA
ncbi:sensor histidine kinase [Massilia soli]|uniref:histidine kinase n=1 Tax=Massilia soli TaxID=2792854 RepID=A0ABS7SM15_9BURK|nr:HAMP domain-containing histidine kinase [Massilia soli]